MTHSQSVPLLTEAPSPPDDRGLGGLIATVRGAARPLPLQQVTVRATLAGSWCRTVIEQRFANPYDAVLDAVHLFPLPEDGAIIEAELRAGDTVVRAECRERGEAERTYAEARTAGHRAMLVTQERPDIHTLRVTNLPPRTEVIVRLVIVETLDAEDGEVRWRFPTTIAPRYLPGMPTGQDGTGVLPDTDRAPDASRLQPPLRLAGGTRLDLEVHIAGEPASVTSSLHAVRMSFEGGLRVAPSTSATLDRDFILSVKWGQPTVAGVRAWTDGTHTLVQVDGPTGIVPPALPRDAIFVVDISGSMEGTKMDAARRALAAALHGLAPGDRFRLLAFDDRVEAFAPGYSSVDDRTLAKADAWIARLHARGGTEMLPAIQAALDGVRPEGRVTTVLFITDGQVHNDQELIAAVAGRARGARFFTLGIDTAVNGALLKRMARVGGAACTLTTPDGAIADVVARIEARLGAPLAADVVVSGDPAVPEPGILFAGRPMMATLLGSPTPVTVRFTTPTGPVTLTAVPERVEAPLGPIWARARVGWLEDRVVLRPFEEEAIRPEVIQIAISAGISSRYTAFVAVDRSVTTTGAHVEVIQPHELPAEWDGSHARGAGAVLGGAMMVPSPGGMPVAARPRGAGGSSRTLSRIATPSPAYDADAIDALASPPPAPARGLFQELTRRFSPKAPDKADASNKPTVAPADRTEALALTQGADGSFGGDVRRTAAALLVLVWLGHTRFKGLRKRNVVKAATWLEGRSADPIAQTALAALAAAEAGAAPSWLPGWDTLLGAGEEGAALAEAKASG